MPVELSWKIGFEIELLAPAGVSRRDLAEAVAARGGGTVSRFFHPQSEPSAVPGQPVFENLTLGFAVIDKAGRRTAAFVDDLTLQADLDRRKPPIAGWYRVVADDARLLRLAMRHCDAEAAGEVALDPLAALFGTAPQRHPSGMVRIVDEHGASVAISAPLPGERERPCEIVTAPIESGHERALDALLGEAERLGFGLSIEGATHLHFDATRLCSAPVIAAVVRLFGAHREALRDLVGVNPNCVRLGPWPKELVRLVEGEAFARMGWDEARGALVALPLTKYCDFNLVNIANHTEAKHTFEVRILPATLDARRIAEWAALFETLLAWCCANPGAAGPLPPLAEFAKGLARRASLRQ